MERKDIPIDLLDRDPLNPRDEPPTDNLIDSLKKVGFKHPIITRPTGNGRFYVTNGWERVQAALIVGFDRVPCEIYPDELSAMKAGRADSIVREWPKHTHMIHINNYYTVCREKYEMDHKSAVEKTVSDNDITHSTVERYIRVWSLPDSVKALLKQPKKRLPTEWIILSKHNRNIRRHSSPLHVSVADYIVKYGSDLPEWNLLDIAANVIGKEASEAKKIVREACREHNRKKSIGDIIDGTKTRSTGFVVLRLSGVMLSFDEKKYILEYIAKRRIKLNDFLRNLLREFIASSKGKES